MRLLVCLEDLQAITSPGAIIGTSFWSGSALVLVFAILLCILLQSSYGSPLPKNKMVIVVKQMAEKGICSAEGRNRWNKTRWGQKNERERERSCWSGVINHSSVDLDKVKHQALKVYFTPKMFTLGHIQSH